MGKHDFEGIGMTGTLEKSALRLSGRKVHGRAINAVADLLRKQLSVPNIYLEPKIASIPQTDVLAVDRAGSGDLYAVEIKTISTFRTRSQLRSVLEQIKLLPFHYKYLALPEFLANLDGPLKFADYPELFDESGIGRVGILSFDSTILDSSGSAASAVKIVIRPERFRVKAEKMGAIEKFLVKAKPDIAVRI